MNIDGKKTWIVVALGMVCATALAGLKIIEPALWEKVLLGAFTLWGGRELLTDDFNDKFQFFAFVFR